VVAEETIRHETKFSAPRLTKALQAVHPTMGYRRESGTVCVPSRPKYVRSKTTQIAKSIVRAVADCAHPEIQAFYLRKYGHSAWLGPLLHDLASEAGFSEPRQGSPNLSEVPSQSQSQKKKEQQDPRDAEWGEWLDHFQEVTGKTSTTGSATARRNFNARRAEGRSLADLKLATIGCHSDEHLRKQGFNRPETILQDSKVERYIDLARSAKDRKDPLAIIAARAA
jgi:hypothetical protein